MAVQTTDVMVKEKRDLEKDELLVSLQGLLEIPMVILSLTMLLLFLIEISIALPPAWSRTFNLIAWAIWVTFVLEFVVKISLARNKLLFLKQNVLMALSVVLPVLRILRIFRAARAFRSLGTLKIITLGNRTIRQLGVLFERRRLQYVGAVVAAVILVSGAGAFYLERGVPGANILSVTDGLWWAAGTITTVGTERFPVTGAGRILGFIVMVFGVSVFGYVAASLATFFIQIDESELREQESVSGPDGESRLVDLVEQIKSLEERIEFLTHVSGELQNPSTANRA